MNRETEPLVAESAAFRAILEQARAIAASPHPVLLLGETGSGKERVARFIHEQGPRRDRPFVAVNCAGIPEALLASEMFGHVRGAFTSSESDRVGHLRAAAEGTLLLDEVGDLPVGAQAVMLRALDGREVYPVGSDRPFLLQARVIAATNHELEDLARCGKFRPDLYYRLAGSVLHISPLRERREDILPLANAILDSIRKRGDADGVFIGPEAKEVLMKYHWPGNVRELQNALMAAVHMGGALGLAGIGRFLALAGGPTDHLRFGVLKVALGREPTKTETKLLVALQGLGRTSIATLAKAVNENRETARRHLEPLTRAGLVSKGGSKRGAWVAPRVSPREWE